MYEFELQGQFIICTRSEAKEILTHDQLLLLKKLRKLKMHLSLN